MSCSCNREPEDDSNMDMMMCEHDHDMNEMIDSRQPDYFGAMVALTRDLFEESEAEKDAYVAMRITLGFRDAFGNPKTQAEERLMLHEAYVEGLAMKAQMEAAA